MEAKKKREKVALKLEERKNKGRRNREYQKTMKIRGVTGTITHGLKRMLISIEWSQVLARNCRNPVATTSVNARFEATLGEDSVMSEKVLLEDGSLLHYLVRGGYVEGLQILSTCSKIRGTPIIQGKALCSIKGETMARKIRTSNRMRRKVKESTARKCYQ